MDKYMGFNVYGSTGCLYVAIIMQLTLLYSQEKHYVSIRKL